MRSVNSDRNKFLLDLPGANERLELVEADLNKAESFKVKKNSKEDKKCFSCKV